MGWVLLPIRWSVVRTFAWLGRCRRLGNVQYSEAFDELALIQLMLNRLRPTGRDPAFR